MISGQKTQRLGSENREIREKETTDRDQIQKLAKGDRIKKQCDSLFSVLAEYPQLILCMQYDITSFVDSRKQVIIIFFLFFLTLLATGPLISGYNTYKF